MKKYKLLNPLMVGALFSTPALLLSSCARFDYDTVAEQIKVDEITEFLNMETIRRPTFAGAEGFEHIKTRMLEIGKAFEVEGERLWQEPTGYDCWSSVPHVQAAIKSALNPNDEPYDEDSDYYQLAVQQNTQTGEWDYRPYGNLWYDIPANGLSESEAASTPPIVLQAHYDMNMSYKNDGAHKLWLHGDPDSGRERGVIVDFDEDAEVITSDGQTSLGADNGLGVCLMLAIAKNWKSFKHGKIRLFFTCDESGSATFWDPNSTEHPTEEDIFASGADLMFYDQTRDGVFDFYDPIRKVNDSAFTQGSEIERQQMDDPYPFGQDFSYSNIISLDGNTKAELFQSASGVHECHLSGKVENKIGKESAWPIKEVESTELVGDEHQLRMVKISVENLNGGHSGYDIGKGFANAIQVLSWCLNFEPENSINDEFVFELANVRAGESVYSIPKEGEATFIVSKNENENDEDFKNRLDEKVESAKSVFLSNFPKESEMKITAEIVQQPDEPTTYHVLKKDLSIQLVLFIESLLYGPLSWYKDGQVQTSVNFAPWNLDYRDEGTFELNLGLICRSGSEIQLEEWTSRVHSMIKYNLRFWTDPDVAVEGQEIKHVNLPVWEAPKDERPTKLISLLDNALLSFGYTPKHINSHAWLEIASFPRIFEEDEKEPPLMVSVGPTIFEAHTINETVWTDTMGSVIKSVLYSLLNANVLKV